MNRRERRRLEQFSSVKQGLISVAEAGRYLAVSERQARRIWKRYKQHGDGGLIHGLRERKSNSSKEALRKKFLSRSLVECPNYGPKRLMGGKFSGLRACSWGGGPRHRPDSTNAFIALRIFSGSVLAMRSLPPAIPYPQSWMNQLKSVQNSAHFQRSGCGHAPNLLFYRCSAVFHWGIHPIRLDFWLRQKGELNHASMAN